MTDYCLVLTQAERCARGMWPSLQNSSEEIMKKKAIYTDRGMEIFHELSAADLRSELLRALAEAIAHMEKRFENVLTPRFKFYEDEEK